jgi:hypothetical protein
MHLVLLGDSLRDVFIDVYLRLKDDDAGAGEYGGYGREGAGRAAHHAD